MFFFELQSILPRTSLLTIYKSFIRAHLDKDDVVSDEPSNDAFSNQWETVQYNAALAITGAIKKTSREELYQELGLEYLQQRRWMRRICLFCKVFSTKVPAHVYDFVPPARHLKDIQTHLTHSLAELSILKNHFFLEVISEGNKLNPQILSSGSYNIFWKSQLNFIRPNASKVFNINDAIGIKLITRLRLGFSHLRECKFKHKFTH